MEQLIRTTTVEADPEANEMVFDRILEAFEKSRARKPVAVQPNIWRVIMKNRMARFAMASAVMLAITGVLYVGLTGDSATAAERLEQVIESNGSYKGWLHITNSLAQEVPEDSSFYGEGTVHMNTADGTMIIDARQNGERKIQYYSPPEQAYIEYSSLEGKVVFYDLNSFPTERLVEMFPLTVDAMLKLARQSTGKDPYRIEISRDGDYERYDITLFENEEEAVRTREEAHTELPLRVTIWVETETHLIRKLEYGPMLGTIDYGEPFIEDIHDLGVPSDTPVIDHRKTVEVEAILERLDRRIRGFGDYFAVKTETPLNEDGTSDLDYCAVSLHIQSNQAWLWSRYLVGVDHYSPQNPRKSVMETPDTWPVLDLDKVLERLKTASPANYHIYDGRNFYSNTTQMPGRGDIEQVVNAVKDRFHLTREIWLTGRDYGPGTKMELVESNGVSGQIGLRIEYGSHMSPLVMQRREVFYWFDPGRDDMPVKKFSRDHMANGQTGEDGFHTVYLDYAQLPDGRWFPTRWQIYTGTEDSRKSIREFQLTLLTDFEIEADWFKPPAERDDD
jgi:hypothetical protein